MAKITERHIVDFLKGKVEKLQKKVQKVQATLNTLKATHDIGGVKLKKKEKKIIKATVFQSEKVKKTQNIPQSV